MSKRRFTSAVLALLLVNLPLFTACDTANEDESVDTTSTPSPSSRTPPQMLGWSGKHWKDIEKASDGDWGTAAVLTFPDGKTATDHTYDGTSVPKWRVKFATSASAPMLFRAYDFTLNSSRLLYTATSAPYAQTITLAIPPACCPRPGLSMNFSIHSFKAPCKLYEAEILQ